MDTLNAPKSIKDRLQPRERLLWWDRPKQGIVLRKADIFLIPFSVLWLAFSISWEAMALSKNAPWFFPLWGVPFILIGLYMAIGRFFYDAWRRARTAYGLTDDRVLIATPSECRSLLLDHLGEMLLSEGGGGTGSIAFGREPMIWEARDGTLGTGAPTVPTLEGIRDAPRVFAAIREAQKKAGSGR